MRPRLLDLYCSAGGCSVGYYRAGFDVFGVDIAPQPNYPFAFVQGDALEYLAAHGREFDAIHASPPCQRYSRMGARWRNRETKTDLVGYTRDMLAGYACPWVIENVSGAPLGMAGMLCGTMFGLKVFRHRWFESRNLLLFPAHPKHDGDTCARSTRPGKGYRGGRNGYVTVTGRTCAPDLARAAMGIDWMSGKELSQAIPPAYTEFIGRQLLACL